MARGDKWRRTYQNLRSQILSLPPGTPLGKTKMEIAQQLGVNLKTVHRALQVLKSEKLLMTGRGLGLRVHPHRPAEIREGAAILYIASRSAWESPFMKEMTRAITETAGKRDLNVLPVFLDEFDMVARFIKTGRVVGALVSMVMGVQKEEMIVRALQKLGVPVCTIDDSIPGFDSVEFDNVALGRRMARWLFTRKSFEKVLICSRRNYAAQEYAREKGMREVMDEMRVPHQRVTWYSAFNEKDIAPLKTFLEAGLKFDAVFIHYVPIRFELEKMFGEAGLPVPKIMSIVDRETLEAFKLSGIAVSTDEMGRMAVETLLKRCQEPGRPIQRLLSDKCTPYEYRP